MKMKKTDHLWKYRAYLTFLEKTQKDPPASTTASHLSNLYLHKDPSSFSPQTLIVKKSQCDPLLSLMGRKSNRKPTKTKRHEIHAPSGAEDGTQGLFMPDRAIPASYTPAHR